MPFPSKKAQKYYYATHQNYLDKEPHSARKIKKQSESKKTKFIPQKSKREFALEKRIEREKRKQAIIQKQLRIIRREQTILGAITSDRIRPENVEKYRSGERLDSSSSIRVNPRFSGG